jgi:Na+/phosphate symporter
MSVDVVLFWTCVVSVVAFFISLILLFTLKDEKAKIAGYVMLGFLGLFLLSLLGYHVTKPVDVKP